MSFWDIFAFSNDVTLGFVVAICILFSASMVLIVLKRVRVMDAENIKGELEMGAKETPAEMEQKQQDDFL